MKHLEILEAIKEFVTLTSEQIQNEIKPIIKSYDKEFLSSYLGVSKEHLYRICKRLFVENNERVQFTTYIKIVALGKNPYSVEKVYKPRKKRINTTPEKRKEALRDYQKKYYEEVTKKKRQEKKKTVTNN
jgi:hypothetical protein